MLVDEFPQGFLMVSGVPRYLPAQYVRVGAMHGLDVYQDGRVPVTEYSGESFRVLILGFFGSILEGAFEDALADASQHGLGQLLDVFADSVGRWVALIECAREVVVINDSIGARSVYYAVNENLVGSHVDLVRRNSTQQSSRASRTVTHAYSLDLTEVDHLRALLPNFYYSLTKTHVRRFFPLIENCNSGKDPEQLIDRIDILWRRGVRWALSLPYRHLSALTAGFDTRLLWAMQHDLVDDMEYFTYKAMGAELEDGFSARTWTEDVRVGQTIANLYHLPYRVIEFGQSDVRLSEEDRGRVLMNAPLGHGVDLVKHYHDNFGKMETVLHRSSALEIGREYYFSSIFTGANLEEARRVGKIEFSKAPDAEVRSESPDDLLERYCGPMGLSKSAELGYPVTTLMYWECRVGRFHSEVLNGLDSSLIPINSFSSRRLWDALLALPVQRRTQNWHHFMLVAKRAPELNALPVNGRDHLIESLETSMAPIASANTLIEEKQSPADWSARVVTGDGTIKPLDSVQPHVIYIPAEWLSAGTWVEASVQLVRVYGGMALAFRSPYSIGQASRVMDIELLVNDWIRVTEDIGFTDEIIYARVSGLQRGDRVTLRVRARVDLPSSWQGASRLEILKWGLTDTRADSEGEVRVGWSSSWGVTQVL